MKNFNEYMAATSETAIYPNEIPEGAHPRIVSLLYCAIKFSGEAGEVSEQIGKALRDDGGQITQERVESIVKEMGDVLWYFARICHILNIDFTDVMVKNIDKLRSRKARGVLGGSGSDR